MKMNYLIGSLCVLCLLASLQVSAEVRLPQFFSNSMVLQRDGPVKIWGTASRDEAITVLFLDKEYKTAADSRGRWEVTLPATKYGGPYTISVNDKKIEGVLIGDVWLCSGQSNMETTISRVMDLYSKEVLGYENPNIRHIKIGKGLSFEGQQQDVGRCQWLPISQKNVMDYSAICYFFAKRMYETTGVPVGIINSSVGGSSIEQWMSVESLDEFPAVRNVLGMIGSPEYIKAADQYDRVRQSAWRNTLDENDRGLIESWERAELNDNNWTKTDMFASEWQRDERYQAINGSVWFRKSFDVGNIDTSKEAILRLGNIVDADYAYINGKLVGSTSYQYPPRVYKIPADVLHSEENVVAIRIISNSGRAQFVKDKPYELSQGATEVNLAGEWSYRRGAVMPAVPPASYRGGNPTGLYNAMLAPLFGYAVKGAIWYQGESNAGRAWCYEQMLTRMIESWRAGFNQPDMPFFIVQLPLYQPEKPEPSNSSWAELREAQAKVTSAVPNTMAIVTIDTGEWNDIHPRDKKIISDRIALAARKSVYKEQIVASGPVFESSTVDGDKIVIAFAKEGGKLISESKLKGFAIAGADRKFVWAEAWTEGNSVVVSSSRVANPKYVRYAWADNPGALNLFNTDGFVAMPFRTDK